MITPKEIVYMTNPSSASSFHAIPNLLTSTNGNRLRRRRTGQPGEAENPGPESCCSLLPRAERSSAIRAGCSISAVILALCLISNVCTARVHDVLCHNGNSSFAADFRTGIKVIVGPQKSGELAKRVCQAALGWDRQNLLVASEASEIDLDMFGVDLDTNQPVAAFQIKTSETQCCMTYQIYLLEKPPRLLRTISGGAFFSAADTDLDGRVEIWTDDAAAVDGFDGLLAREMEFVPIYVLRLEHERLLDVSAEFQTYFNQVIAKLKAEITPAALRNFKLSDGKLRHDTPSSPKELTRLTELNAVKIRVLEIAWAYLYSGREQEAWQTLLEMWPDEDVERIRSEIVRTRAHGMYTQLDGVLKSAAVAGKERAKIYRQSEVTPAQPILLGCYAAPCGLRNQPVPEAKARLDLVIDSAGKVRSVKPAGSKDAADEYVIRSAEEWKFIPAFKAGRSVASRLRAAVALMR